MKIDSLTLNSAIELIKAKDKRFDGRFYWGVKTTKIYCRPTCGANPNIKNITIYKSKAEAEAAGLRPCLKCRPDISPQSPLWEGTGAVVQRALKLLSQDVSLPDIYKKLSLSDRHLRRLFNEHLGASPIEVQLSERLHNARHLLEQTSISITDVAYASGFKSLRRFNDAFKSKYKQPPSYFRKNKIKNSDFICLYFKILEPYDWNFILNFFKRHFITGSEFVAENSFYRFIKIENKDKLVRIKVSKHKDTLQVEVRNCPTLELKKIIFSVKSVFDVHHNPYFLVLRDKRWSGVRIPGGFDTFETCISIILGQLVSTEQAQVKIRRLVYAYGEDFESQLYQGMKIEDNLTYKFFPTPHKLLKADLKFLGITKVRENAIKEVSKLAISSQLNDLEKLSQIKGIGPWTLNMIKMRCFSDTNAYPSQDLIVKRAENLYKIDPQLWDPWKSYLALNIWRKYAHKLSNKSSTK